MKILKTANYKKLAQSCNTCGGAGTLGLDGEIKCHDCLGTGLDQGTGTSQYKDDYFKKQAPRRKHPDYPGQRIASHKKESWDFSESWDTPNSQGQQCPKCKGKGKWFVGTSNVICDQCNGKGQI